MIQLDEGWAAWLQEHIRSRTPQESMIQTLVGAGFDAATAKFVVAQAAAPGEPLRMLTPKPAYVPPFPLSSGAIKVYKNDSVPIANTNRIDVGDRIVKVGLRIDRPCVVLFDNLLSDEECDEVIKRARPKLKPSATVDVTTAALKVTEHRISQGTFFRRGEDEFFTRLEARISRLLNWPVENGEGMVILHYKAGGDQYHPHYDFFPPQNIGSHKRMAVGGQRFSTLITYLNDVEEGGETFFPNVGVSIAPRKGSALYFQYSNALNQVDPLSLHGGRPIVAGEKWIMTKWMRQRPYALPDNDAVSR